MSVHAAIRRAEQLLPGEAAAEGEDPRWQAIIGVGKHIEMRPEVVRGFVRKWGCHTDNDLRQAVATCLLEHLLEYHFELIFQRVEELALSDRHFADTFLRCWKFGQSEVPANSAKFDSLASRLQRLA